MQHLFNQRALWQSAALRSMLLGPVTLQPSTILGPRMASYFLRNACLIPSPRWVSTSGAVWTTAPRKSTTEEGHSQADPGQEDILGDRSIGLVQRFRRTLKQYGKVMIPLHLITSSMWFGTFYYAAMQGINVVPFLEYVGFPEKLVKLLEHSQSGYALTAYAMYKIATPARYTVTLGGTSLSIRYLRKHGHMTTPPPVKEYLQDKMEETRERLSEKMEETKDRFSEKMEETRDRLSGRIGDNKDKLAEKLQETKDKVSFRKKPE
ncbi:uncharacterized protein C18orf19 homolog A isoform 1-T2 [Salvelinus alpinus]|uniref:Family with sequence similarity 210 member Aa n=1 Tax=Salmo trutta TaxID=8032 RepID=A0A674CKU2_SALTR|nr:uncharacterized protein C18orf19 homolog A [Salvelinus alpinus]XP_023855517.1 uncharacterized protein C18orf19 homolog A [Salvelinus alpinus]XP_029592047.1 protein FAM210A [Salmo trutta]XP_055749142.1 uncharacterized protein C18orf19 homolog A [Salvelinus fontinalis]XP_055749143.1 uncharacterized protein C18orf19 homolog A [Salvelinus fontinalis]XP_055749144.1 uncharacterized protein C18orf19 homolog A [Salvelinus fontinalis]